MFGLLALIGTLSGFKPQLLTLSSSYPSTGLCDFKGNFTVIAKDRIRSIGLKLYAEWNFMLC